LIGFRGIFAPCWGGTLNLAVIAAVAQAQQILLSGLDSYQRSLQRPDLRISGCSSENAWFNSLLAGTPAIRY
jgi:hypothetical protein